MRFQNLFMKEVISMDNVLRQILRENQFFEEMNENNGNQIHHPRNHT